MIHYSTWPRASAVAEILWRAPEPQYSLSSVMDITTRMEEQVCRMNRREIQAQPPNGPGFCPVETL